MIIYAPTYCPGTVCDPCARYTQVGGIATCHFTSGPISGYPVGVLIAIGMNAIVTWTDLSGSHSETVNAETTDMSAIYEPGAFFTVDFGWSTVGLINFNTAEVAGANVIVSVPGVPFGTITAAYDSGLSLRLAPVRVRATGRRI